MKFDILLYTCDNLFDAGVDGESLIRINGLSEEDAGTLASVLAGTNVNVCLLPYKE